MFLSCIRQPIALLCLIMLLSLGNALGQQRTLREQLIGTWTYVSVDVVQADGKRNPMYGPNPQGVAMFDANGRYMLFTARDGMAKFASNNRLEGTSDEYKAVVQGSIAHFGRYQVNEAAKTITFHIETSTFPNWNRTDQQRPVSISGNELKWVTPGSSGGTAEVVLKRAE